MGRGQGYILCSFPIIFPGIIIVSSFVLPTSATLYSRSFLQPCSDLKQGCELTFHSYIPNFKAKQLNHLSTLFGLIPWSPTGNSKHPNSWPWHFWPYTVHTNTRQAPLEMLESYSQWPGGNIWCMGSAATQVITWWAFLMCPLRPIQMGKGLFAITNHCAKLPLKLNKPSGVLGSSTKYLFWPLLAH